LSLAFVFPGQGSQAVGMQAELAAVYPQIEASYQEASDVLGFDLWKLTQEGPTEALGQTINTQPAMLVAAVAVWHAWHSAGGPAPTMLSGHSLGEYTALVCAGAMSFVDGVRLVRRRGELMQNAVPDGEGAMAAVLGLDEDVIMEVCAEASMIGVAEPVNFNSPGQVVVAGHQMALMQLVGLAKDAGARRAIMLPVSVPSHSSLMRPAGEALIELLDTIEFKMPETTVISTVDATPYDDAADIGRRLSQQVYSPVHWVSAVQKLIENGATHLVECGPGKILTGLNKRIDRSVPGVCIDSPAALVKSIEEAKQ
jgi:[acyl-carrier-protein] S-malonyltransferase